MKKKYHLTGYIKYITDHEFKQIKNYVDKKIESPPMKMCIKILMYLGLRSGEVVELKRDNFNKDFSELTFTVKKTHKIKERKVQKKLSKGLIRYYKKYKARMINEYLFFPTYKNQSTYEHLQRNCVSAKFGIIRNDLNIKHVYYTCKDGKKLHRLSSHTLRHYAIYRYYIASNKDIIAAQQIIGHDKTETTAKYIYNIEAKNNEQKIIEKAFKF